MVVSGVIDSIAESWLRGERSGGFRTIIANQCCRSDCMCKGKGGMCFDSD